jgi:hypothetical protein
MTLPLAAALLLAATHGHAGRWIAGWIVLIAIVAAGAYLARRRRPR